MFEALTDRLFDAIAAAPMLAGGSLTFAMLWAQSAVYLGPWPARPPLDFWGARRAAGCRRCRLFVASGVDDGGHRLVRMDASSSLHGSANPQLSQSRSGQFLSKRSQHPVSRAGLRTLDIHIQARSSVWSSGCGSGRLGGLGSNLSRRSLSIGYCRRCRGSRDSRIGRCIAGGPHNWRAPDRLGEHLFGWSIAKNLRQRF